MDDLVQDILDNLYEGVYLIDAGRVVTFWNKSAERITGFKACDVVGKYCSDGSLNHLNRENARLRTALCPVHRTLVDGRRREADVCLRHRNGQKVEVSVKTLPLYDSGKIVGAAEVFTESARKTVPGKAAPNAAEDAALYDPLTALPNRRYIDFYLGNRMAEFERLGISFSVIMADVDHLRRVNDTYGPETGDRVVKAIASTIRAAFRKSDFVGRWDGAEFMVIVIGVSDEDLIPICEKLRLLVRSAVVKTERDPVGVTISVGSSIAREGDTAAVIQQRADSAVRESKRAGRDAVTIL